MLRLAAIVLGFVAVTGCSKIPGLGADSPTSPSPSPADGPVSYTAVGASDGIGYGGSAPCVPFTECPSGTGYVQEMARRFAGTGRQTTHLNLSIPGAVMSRAVEDLAGSIGRSVPGNFVDREAPFVPTSTTHVTLFAGGNDANTIGAAAKAGVGGGTPEAFVDAQVRQWGDDLVTLVERIRARAPNARIVALNLPNLAASPYVASSPIAEKQLMQRIAVGLTDQVNALSGRNVVVVDLMCDARLLQPGNYAADGFHPNDSGYAIIADLVWPALRDGTAPAPSNACGPRSVF